MCHHSHSRIPRTWLPRPGTVLCARMSITMVCSQHSDLCFLAMSAFFLIVLGKEKKESHPQWRRASLLVGEEVLNRPNKTWSLWHSELTCVHACTHVKADALLASILPQKTLTQRFECSFCGEVIRVNTTRIEVREGKHPWRGHFKKYLLIYLGLPWQLSW